MVLGLSEVKIPYTVGLVLHIGLVKPSSSEYIN